MHKTKMIAFNGLICALYVLLTIINPFGYGMIQIRISEALCILPFYNRKYIVPICLGVGIANFFSPLGLIDVLTGMSVAIISYSISKYIDSVLINCIIYSIICGVLVSAELFIILNVPYMISIISIMCSQVIITLTSKIIIDKIGMIYKI